MSSFWDFVRSHWYFAIPMFVMSLSALTLVVWRILLNLQAKTDMDEFLPLFQQKLDKEGIEGTLQFCRSREDFIPRKLFAAGLETSKQGLAAMRRSMANVIELEILPDLNFLLAPILAIAKIATMLGLLLTVFSMIGTFTEIDKSAKSAQKSTPEAKAPGEPAAKGGVAQQAGAIGLALFGTAMGLVIAIPLVF